MGFSSHVPVIVPALRKHSSSMQYSPSAQSSSSKHLAAGGSGVGITSTSGPGTSEVEGSGIVASIVPVVVGSGIVGITSTPGSTATVVVGSGISEASVVVGSAVSPASTVVDGGVSVVASTCPKTKGDGERRAVTSRKGRAVGDAFIVFRTGIISFCEPPGLLGLCFSSVVKTETGSHEVPTTACRVSQGAIVMCGVSKASRRMDVFKAQGW